MYDIIVVGGGPAGLTAAIYGLRNGKSVFVIEKNVFGGQIVNSPKVENIPGFDSISGDEFADKMLEQAMNQGAEVTLEEVVEVEKKQTEDKYYFCVKTAEGGEYEAASVILATGTTHRTLGLDGEEELIGKNISFCAVCDGDFYRDKTVVMIGGGNSAFVESNLLVSTVKKLIILQDMDFFTADKKLQDELLSHDNVETHLGVKILSYETGYDTENDLENTVRNDLGHSIGKGEKKLTGVRYEEAGVEKTAKCDGVFLAIGLVPENGIFTGLADVDGAGYFVAEDICNTKTPGIYVAGDCRAKTLRQVATACSDGAYAAMAASASAF